jgi:hypothetical protein
MNPKSQFDGADTRGRSLTRPTLAFSGEVSEPPTKTGKTYTQSAEFNREITIDGFLL